MLPMHQAWAPCSRCTLIIDPTYGGQMGDSENGYALGPPELIVEVASSSEVIALNTKRWDDEQAGVLEYAAQRIS